MTEPYVYVRSLMFLLSRGSPGETGWSEVLGTSEWNRKIKRCLHERAILGFKKRSDDGTGNNRRSPRSKTGFPVDRFYLLLRFPKSKNYRRSTLIHYLNKIAITRTAIVIVIFYHALFSPPPTDPPESWQSPHIPHTVITAAQVLGRAVR